MRSRWNFSNTLQRARAVVAASRRALIAGVAALAVALALRAAAAQWPDATEQYYARGLYPWIHRAQVGVSGLAPVSCGELLLVALLAVVLVRSALLLRNWFRPRTPRLEHTLRELLHGALLAAWIYVIYLCAWAYNYARLPYAHGTALEVRTSSADELDAAAREWLQRATELRKELPEDAERVVTLSDDFERQARAIADAWARAGELDPRLAGPAPVLRAANASWLMTAAGITGIYWPFTGEPHVNVLAPLPQRIFAALHEVAHERGFAREDEANYLAVKVGANSGDRELAYSAALMAFLHLRRSLSVASLERSLDLQRETDARVQLDLNAIHKFWAAPSKTVQAVREVSSTVNDTYLKVQGQSQGVRSYGRMVDLLLAERRARLAAEQH